MTFEYRDDASCDKLVAQPDTDDNRKPVVFISTTGLNNGVYVPVDRVEEVVAGIRDTARTAAGRPAGPLTHTAAANAAAWAIAQEKAATDGAARTASGQTDGVKRSPDATVDPTMCPRCKGDNQEAFELCGNCTASGQQPETTPTCTSTHPARPTRCILPGRHAVPHTDGACQWPETVPAVGQPAEAQATDEAPLTAAERQFLKFALDLAFDRMVSDSGFTDEDDAALARLRRMAEEARS